MNELDRRVAVEVMGEPEPKEEPPEPVYMGLAGIGHVVSGAGNWQGVEVFGEKDGVLNARLGLEWQPLPFSSSLDLALGAVDKCLTNRKIMLWLSLQYCAPLHEWDAHLINGSGAIMLELDDEKVFHSAPEAICSLLLAFVERGVGMDE